MKRLIEGEDRQQVTMLPECLDDYIAEDCVAESDRAGKLSQRALCNGLYCLMRLNCRHEI